MVSVLGSLRASILIHITALLGLGTMLLCYTLALSFKHVKLWPIPMISDCAVESPEKFPFRLGMVTFALLMALGNLVVYLAAVPRSKLALVFGVTACMCLAVVGVVNEEEASKVHSSKYQSQPRPTFALLYYTYVIIQIFCKIVSVSAVIFFMFYWFNMITLTVVSSKVLLPWCRPKTPLRACLVTKLVIRQALTVFCGLALIAAAIVSILSCVCA